MTREEAIEKMKFLRDNACNYYLGGKETANALDMVIEILKQPEIVHCKDCKSNRNEDGTTGCDFHNFWYAADDGYCNFGQRRGEE